MNNLLLVAWGAAATFTGVDGEQGDVSGVAAGSWRCKMRRVSFDASGVRVDEVTGRLGGGNVVFGGRIGLDGFALGGTKNVGLGKLIAP